MGTDNPGIPPDGEGPQRSVNLETFYMDIHEVTNHQFKSFINATGYVTEVRCPLHISTFHTYPEIGFRS